MYSLIVETKAIYRLSNTSDYFNFKNKTLSSTNKNLLEDMIGNNNKDKEINKNNNNKDNTTITTNTTTPIASSSSTTICNNNTQPKKPFFKRVLIPDSIIVEGILQPAGFDVSNIKGKGKQQPFNSLLKSPSSSTTTTTTITTTTSTAIQSPSKITNSTDSLNSNNNENKETIPFFSGNPNIEVIEGVLHLFINTTIEKNLTSSLCQLPNSRTNIVCIESVPSYMSIPDLIGFLQASCDLITDMKIIRDASPNKYMVLLRFKDQNGADEFYQLYNGKNFSSFEPETCIILYISKVEYQSSSPTYNIMSPPPTTSGDISLNNIPNNSIELPNCPVCLDRLDSASSGIVTVLCHHSFHCDCLSKWKGDNTCPVCRYVQVPTVESKSVCATCQSTESLWICIICGQVGCSRYVNSHANKHYEDTMHTFALELETQRVWDYAGDGYVHRLIQNRSDGKVLEFPNPHQSSDTREGSHLKEEKIESIVMEYNFLLTSQLEQQRAYFEQVIGKIEKEHGYRINQLKEEIDKTNTKWSTKFTKLKQKGDDGDKETSFLKQINSAMKENQEKFKQTEEEKDKMIIELSEELRDLRFFIEAQKTFLENDELKDASIVMPINNNNNVSTGGNNSNNNNSNNNSNINGKKQKKKK